jgi:hypothetical protein
MKIKLKYHCGKLLPLPAALIANDFNQRPFAAAAVKLTVKNALPGPKIQPAIGDGYNHLTSHDLAFHVGIGIVLAHIMTVL